MDPTQQFCHNQGCVASGQIGQGNIGIHSRKDKRYRCNVCGKTFTETKGTPFYRARKAHAEMTLVIILLASGCPLPAIVAAFEWAERTVRRVQTAAGAHCQAGHEHLVEQPRDLGHIQADEIWVRAPGASLWLALARQVPTRLWWGAAVSTRRERKLLPELFAHVRARALCRPRLFCVDGLRAYVRVIYATFREALPTGHAGRPRLRPWDGIHIAQVVKQYAGRRISGVQQRVQHGSAAVVLRLIRATQGAGGINTAYIERLNATFRARLAPLARRPRAKVRASATLHAGVYLVGTVYNFCTYHQSLRIEFALLHQKRRWLRRPPAIAAGITDHCWSVYELLSYQVPHPPVLPKRRGRPTKAFLALKKQWLG